MKTDRLIGILSILLQEEKTTAPELAEKFEGSRRTINRDIEDLCKAGIPIRTAQGTGGGISIMDGYRMDRTILTSKDMQMILAGLRSLDSVSGNRYYGQLMEKIQRKHQRLIRRKMENRKRHPLKRSRRILTAEMPRVMVCRQRILLQSRKQILILSYRRLTRCRLRAI